MTKNNFSSVLPSLSTYVDSAYGVLTDVLLCKPHLPVDDNAQGMTLDRALAQYEQLVETLEAFDVRCHFLNEHPPSLHQCHIRDRMAVTPWGVVLGRFNQKERILEQSRMLSWCRDSGASIWCSTEGEPINGADVIVVKPGFVFIGVNDHDSNTTAAYILGGKFISKGWQVKILRYDQKFSRLSSVLGVVDAENIIYCEGSLSNDDLDWLSWQRFCLHEVPADGYQRGSANFLCLGKKRVLVSESDPYSPQILQSLDRQLIAVDLSAFSMEGRGAHSLVLPLRRTSSQGTPTLFLVSGGNGQRTH